MKTPRFRLLAVYVSLTLLLTGCNGDVLPHARKIEEYSLITVMGVDSGEKDRENIAVTLSAKKDVPQQSAGKGPATEGSDKPFILTNEAKSIALAVHGTQTYTQDYVFLGHMQFYLIGEAAAREGVSRYLDFLCRDPDTRFLTHMYVVQDTTARKIMTQISTNENYVGDRLSSMQEDVGIMSLSNAQNLAQIASQINARRGNLLLPLVKLVDASIHDASLAENFQGEDSSTPGKQNQQGDASSGQREQSKQGDASSGQGNAQTSSDQASGDKEKQLDMDIGGYAIIVNTRMVGVIDTGKSRGVNYLQNRVVSDMIETKTEEGDIVALRVTTSSCRLKPVWNGDKLERLNVEIKVSANINENQSPETLMSIGSLQPLMAQQNQQIRLQVESVLSQSQTIGTDYLGIGDTLNHMHPVRFSRLESEWDKTYAQLPIDVKVDSIIRRTFDITQPNYNPAVTPETN